MASTVRSFWIDHLWMDLVIVGVALLLHAFLITQWTIFDIFGNALPADRRAVYAAAAVVVSLLGSFSAVAIGQLGAAKGDRTKALKRQGGAPLARSWSSIFRVAMVAALIALFALLVDPSIWSDSWAYVAVRWIFEAALLSAVVKFIRLSSLFFAVISLANQEASEPEEKKAEAPTPNLNWRRAS